MIQDVCSSWICHGEQSACHVVYYRRGYIPVCARLTYVSFKASESGHFIFMGVTRCRRSFFYLVIRSSLLLLFHTPAFLQSAFLLRADYSEELCSHRPTFHGRQHFTVANILRSGPLVQVAPHRNLGVIIDSRKPIFNGLNLLSRPA